MRDKIIFNYFYGDEADMLSFYRIPKLLFTNDYFKALSTEAKVLYGLMLDRMALSQKNKWFDEENRTYIYFTVENTMELLNCRKNKAIDTIKELDVETGIGLIEKKRQWNQKPTIIYVKSFMLEEQKTDSQTDNVSALKFVKPTSETVDNFSEVGKTNSKRLGKSTSTGLKNQLLEVGKRDSNNTKENNTENNNTNLIISADVDGGLDTYKAYSIIIKKNLDWDILCEMYPYDNELLEGIYDLILETVLCKNDTILIARNEYPVELVKSKFFKLNMSHIEYVIDCLEKNASKVCNIKKYILAALFNAPTTISGYYQAEVNHDKP
ncbi:MAG: replication initiator protein [Herbinix sp.]|nr:replication initiator protein [Herbinix sp.]